ncbi:MAG: hypothetical protein RQM92_00215 [Candidatus Syntrophopropionicum ammoniitolerans]
MEKVSGYDSIAASLFDGGWRAADTEQLKEEYDLNDSDLEEIVARLAEYEKALGEEDEE